MKNFISVTCLVTVLCFSAICANMDINKAVLDAESLVLGDAEPQAAIVATITAIVTIASIISKGREMLKNVNVKDIMKTEIIPYHCDLAQSYGNLTHTIFEEMDNELKVMIGASKISLDRLHKEANEREVKFEEYVATLTQNPFLETAEDGAFFNQDFQGFESFGISTGGYDRAIAEQARSWFINLVQDKDILDSSKIEIEDFVNIVSASGAAVECFATLFYKKIRVERRVVDLGVVRYPDLENPFLKMYQLKIAAYRSSTRLLFLEKKQSGIGGSIYIRKFVPRRAAIATLTERSLNYAVEYAETFFD
ncbi:uncharacterized protein LOC115212730 isoform X4 [Octopus sinensis]|uniref:Uncharacterized protein LOC115212730 isoform X4 n=1 Tax=Octopus sinensis TaxID=2607531 RepID=A0A7E6EYR4_9MOLL|nr:uncharacterized protein LOC115212730 isoform X4 [Octopus sinensis]